MHNVFFFFFFLPSLEQFLPYFTFLGGGSSAVGWRGALSLLVLADWVALGGGGRGVSLSPRPTGGGGAGSHQDVSRRPGYESDSPWRPSKTTSVLPLVPKVGRNSDTWGGGEHPCSPFFLGIKSGEEERSPPGSPFSSISLVYTSSPPLFLFLFLGPTAHGRAARSQRKEKEKPSSSSSSWQHERRKKSLRRNSPATPTPQ